MDGVFVSDALGELGSWRDVGILLHSGQSWYEEPLLSFAGVMPLVCGLRYESGDGYRGMFGKSWRCGYERAFTYLGKGLYRLEVKDGRYFLFERQGLSDYVDVGGLGVEIVDLSDTQVEIHYKDGTVESYTQEKLNRITDRDNNTLHLHYDSQQRLTQVSSNSAASVGFSYGSTGLVERMHDSSGRV